MANVKGLFLRFTSGALFVPCAYALKEHWSVWVGVPILVLFGFLNFADGFERAKGGK